MVIFRLRMDSMLNIEDNIPHANITVDNIKYLSLNNFFNVFIFILSSKIVIEINNIGIKYILPHLKPILSVGWEPAKRNKTPKMEKSKLIFLNIRCI